jgi:hypothetical protein
VASAAGHRFQLDYVEEDCGLIGGGFTERTATDGAGVIVEGNCPRCLGRTASEFRRGVPGTGTKGLRSWFGLATGPAPAPPRDVLHDEVHFCECGHRHPDMPGDTVFIGCGASWRVAP